MKTVGEILGQRDFYAVSTEWTVGQVVDYLCEKGIGAVAVCEGDQLAGIFSERDLMRRVVHKGLDPKETPITKVMTKDVFFVMPDENYSVAKALMLGKNFRHLAVLDEERRFKGFVSMRELLEVDLAMTQDMVKSLNDDYYDHRFRPGGK